MKAGIQSQIEWNKAKISFASAYGEWSLGHGFSIDELKRRNIFLEKVLNAPVSEIDQTALNFIYG